MLNKVGTQNKKTEKDAALLTKENVRHAIQHKSSMALSSPAKTESSKITHSPRFCNEKIESTMIGTS
jgi:hypothetical protein